MAGRRLRGEPAKADCGRGGVPYRGGVPAARPIAAVCVYCGSSLGRDPAHLAQAEALGRRLAGHSITLVYGGGAAGLMGAVADAALAAGGRVIGVIPRGLFDREIVHEGLDELVEVASMHERKQKMFELSDAFVALPGGLGTLEELAEIATWGQLGLHAKPIVTLGSGGYWRPLHALLRSAADAGFVKERNLDLIVDVERVDDVLGAIAAYRAPAGASWLTLDET